MVKIPVAGIELSYALFRKQDPLLRANLPKGEDAEQRD
jgi:hypothetical protein